MNTPTDTRSYCSLFFVLSQNTPIKILLPAFIAKVTGA